MSCRQVFKAARYCTPVFADPDIEGEWSCESHGNARMQCVGRPELLLHPSSIRLTGGARPVPCSSSGLAPATRGRVKGMHPNVRSAKPMRPDVATFDRTCTPPPCPTVSRSRSPAPTAQTPSRPSSSRRIPTHSVAPPGNSLHPSAGHASTSADLFGPQATSRGPNPPKECKMRTLSTSWPFRRTRLSCGSFAVVRDFGRPD